MNNAIPSSSHSKNQRNSEDILADILRFPEFQYYKKSGTKDGNQLYRNTHDEAGNKDGNPGKILSVLGLYDHGARKHEAKKRSEALHDIARRLGVPIYEAQPATPSKSTATDTVSKTPTKSTASEYQKAMAKYTKPLDDLSFQRVKQYFNGSRKIPIDRPMAEALCTRVTQWKGVNKIWIPCRDISGKNVRSYFRILSDNFAKLPGEKGKLCNHGKHGLPANAIVIGGNLERFVIFEGIENALTYYYLSGYEGETILACCGAGNIPAMAEFCKGATSVKVMVDGDVNDGKDYPDYTTNSFQRSLQLRRALPEGVCTLWLPERAKEDINDAHCKGEAQRWLNTLQQFKDETVVDYLLPMRSESDCAHKFIEVYGGEFLFDVRNENKKYMIRANNWKSQKQEITNGVVTNIVPADSIMSDKLARFIDQIAMSNGYDEKQQKEMKSSHFRNGVKRQVEAFSHGYKLDRGVWDINRNLIGTPGNTIDMVNNVTFPARANDYITKQVAAEPKRKDGALWDKSIADWTGGDKELARYIQKVVGLLLFGRVEQLLFFIYGGTGTGKGTFIDTIRHAFADYAKVGELAMLMESKDDTKIRPRPDIIALEGSHVVFYDETKDDQVFDSATIKQLTGNTHISACLKHSNDQREVEVTWNTVISSNSQPIIRNLDPAMERRIVVIPFIHRYAGTAEDKKNLRELLRAPDEVAHLIQYGVDGFTMYQEDASALGNGLIKPKAVEEATKEYFESQQYGQIMDWVDNCCDLGTNPEWKTSTEDLARSYSDYINDSVKSSVMGKRLRERARELHITEGRTSKARFWQGIRLRPFTVNDE